MIKKIVVFLLLCSFYGMMVIPAAAVEDSNNGDWEDKYVTLRNTSEAELMVRVGDIDNVGYGFPEGYDPFNETNYSRHTFPWDTPDDEPDGTDRIMLGSSFESVYKDGYSRYYGTNPDSTKVRSIVMNYDTSGIRIRNAVLQLYIDDFQAPYWGSKFVASINGKNAPFIAELINSVSQTGPIANIITIEIPSSFYSDIASGYLEILIDDPTTGLGDGFAIDFVKLMVNQDQEEANGLIKGYVVDKTTNKPLSGAAVRVLGTSTSVRTGADGTFEIAAYSGINNVRVSKGGYVEIYRNGMVVSDEIIDYGTFYLETGESTVDFDYYSDATEAEADLAMPDLTFSDFDSSHWSYTYVQYMVDLDIISGYPDNTFRPNGTFNRAAFAKLLTLSFDVPIYSGSESIYSDLSSDHWAYSYVMSSNAYLTAYEKSDGTKVYAPDGDAVREDVAVAMVKAMALDPDDADLSLLEAYMDSGDVSTNLRNYVALAIEYGVMQGSNNNFRPQDPLTRAEASTLFARFLMEIKDTYNDDDLIKVTN